MPALTNMDAGYAAIVTIVLNRLPSGLLADMQDVRGLKHRQYLFHSVYLSFTYNLVFVVCISIVFFWSFVKNYFQILIV